MGVKQPRVVKNIMFDTFTEYRTFMIFCRWILRNWSRKFSKITCSQYIIWNEVLILLLYDNFFIVEPKSYKHIHQFNCFHKIAMQNLWNKSSNFEATVETIMSD